MAFPGPTVDGGWTWNLQETTDKGAKTRRSFSACYAIARAEVDLIRTITRDRNSGERSTN